MLGDYQIVALSETWLCADHCSEEFFPDTYKVFRSDRKYDVTGGDRGGGVLLAVDSRFKTINVDLSTLETSLPLIDIVGCQIVVKVSKFSYFVYIFHQLYLLQTLNISWSCLSG